MKVKNLILALGVTGAFVACSQEELVNENQMMDSNRPVVGAVDVKLDVNPESRWAYSGGFSFDENDYMGACLMDIVNNISATDWNSKYTLVNTISSNYKYGYKDNWTNGDAIMSEGNYFFYLPYNEALKGRTGLTYNLPTEQYAYDKDAETPVHNGNLSWIENQMFVGYDDIKTGDQQATPNLVEVFAKPRFNVNYTGSKDIVVERIVVLNSAEPFAVKGQLNIAGATTANYAALNPTVTAYEVASGKTASDVFKMYNQALTDIAAGDLVLADGQKVVSPLAAMGFLSSTTTAPSITLNVVPAKEVSALMVMPAGVQTAANMTIQVYTNKGWVVLNNISGDLTTAAQGTELTYENITKLYDLKSGDGVKADAVEINFGDSDIEVPTSVTVATTAQLESVMRWYETTSDNYVLTVNIASGCNVELTSKVYDIMKGNEELTVKFIGGTLTIPATAAADAWSVIDLANTTSTVVNRGTMDIANTTASMSIAYPLTNRGTLNVSAVSSSKTITFGTTITNYGTINIKTGKVIAGGLISMVNYKNLTVESGATFEANTLRNRAVSSTSGGTTTYTSNAIVTNNGTMTFGGWNECTIENNGKINLKFFENKLVAAVTTGANKTNGYKGVIKNNLTTSYVLAQDAVVNNSSITNYGFVYSQGSGSIENNKYIMAMDGSTTYITTNNGEIELEKRDTETTVNDNNGKTSYTLTASDLTSGAFKFDATSDKFNTLRVGIDMKLTNGSHAPANLILTGATVNCPTTLGGTNNITAPEFESITVESGVNVIKGKQVVTGNLTVGADALIQIPSLSTFGVTGTTTVDAKGEILVGGSFFGDGTQPSTGIFSSAGTGSYTWSWGGTF